jgi:starch synthase
MKILLASSEVVPFAKTGGLADVCGALPGELRKLGHDVQVFLPAFRSARHCGLPLESTPVECRVPLGSKIVPGRLLKSHLPDGDVPVWLVQQDQYYDRDGLYQSGGSDFKDNCERFVFFCRFVLESLDSLNWFPDLLHANDWQTGLLPAYLKTVYHTDPRYRGIASLMTIHNLAYQGTFWHWDMLLTGIDWQYFNWRQMEFHGRLNLLKTGLVFADGLSTVSPRYSLEIQTPEQGCGLDPVLRERREDLVGILNGIDTNVWNPQTDPHLAASYSVADWQEGKPRCKADLQRVLGLPQDPQIPLIGIIGRLASQKGWSLIVEVAQNWLANDIPVQWAVLGTGEPSYEQALRHFQRFAPHRFGVRLEFSDELAHRIEAGADLFLMPSHYEPCGLNQQYSLRYGTVPVVHETGGLADTVVNLDDWSRAAGTANGFSFAGYHPRALEATLERALHTYHQPELWRQLVETGMRQDWSWSASAGNYAELYEAIVSRHPSGSLPT